MAPLRGSAPQGVLPLNWPLAALVPGVLHMLSALCALLALH